MNQMKHAANGNMYDLSDQRVWKRVISSTVFFIKTSGKNSSW